MTDGSPIQQSAEESGDFVPPRTASRHVLIVEDEKRLREMLHKAITEMGLIPQAASSAEAALRLTANHFFAIALLDLNLPGMNGLELCQRLHDQHPHVQVVLLTGFGDLEAAQAAIRLEVVDFLTKPCGMDELENALNRARLRWLDRWGDNVHAEPEITNNTDPNLPVKSAPFAAPSAAVPEQSMEEMERAVILAALERHNGNRQSAAAELGISVRKIYYRLQSYQHKKSAGSH